MQSRPRTRKREASWTPTPTCVSSRSSHRRHDVSSYRMLQASSSSAVDGPGDRTVGTVPIFVSAKMGLSPLRRQPLGRNTPFEPGEPHAHRLMNPFISPAGGGTKQSRPRRRSGRFPIVEGGVYQFSPPGVKGEGGIEPVASATGSVPRSHPVANATGSLPTSRPPLQS